MQTLDSTEMGNTLMIVQAIADIAVIMNRDDESDVPSPKSGKFVRMCSFREDGAKAPQIPTIISS